MIRQLLKLSAFFTIGLLLAGQLFAQSSDRGSTAKNQPQSVTPVPFQNGVATLGPQNSKIEFVGIHVGEKPDPRLGGFEKFKGSVKLGADKSVQAIMLEIDVNSIWTQFDKLTAHLKNSDFFETDKFGMAKFVSSSITPASGTLQIKGTLELHGVAKEISFPVQGKLDDAGILMKGEFKLDRTMFGMDKMTSGVDKSVSVKFVVGEKTSPSKAMPGPGTTKKTDSKGSESKGSGNKGSDAKGSGSKEAPELSSVSLSAPNME